MDTLLLFIIGSIGIWYLMTIRNGHLWPDAGLYIRHAKNLVEGIPYAKTGYIHNPAMDLGPPTYPPIFPLLLVPVYRLFGLNLRAMKAMVALCFLGSLVAMSVAFRDRFAAPYLVTAIAVIGFHPTFWKARDGLTSDIPFLLFTFVSLALINEAYAAVPSWANQVWYGILIGSSTYLAYGTRSLGIALPSSLLFYQALHARRVVAFTLFVVLALAIFSVLLLLQHRYLHSESSRLHRVRATPRALGGQFVRYLRAFYDLWYGGWPRTLHRSLCAVLGGCAGIGYVVGVRRGMTVAELFPLFYMVLITAWPVKYEMERFLIPVLPFFVFYAATGVAAISFLATDTVSIVVGLTLASALVAWYVTRYAAADYNALPDSITSPTAIALYRYVAQETDKRDVFVFFEPRILALFTDRQAVACHRPTDYGELWRYYKEIGVTHVIVGFRDDWSFSFLGEFLDRHTAYLRNVYKNADFALYRIDPFPS